MAKLKETKAVAPQANEPLTTLAIPENDTTMWVRLKDVSGSLVIGKRLLSGKNCVQFPRTNKTITEYIVQGILIEVPSDEIKEVHKLKWN